jgi:hypothetical protein
MRDLPVVFIAVPMKTEGSSLKRPNTEDTIIAWLKMTSQPCIALFVSDQPFCGFDILHFLKEGNSYGVQLNTN